MKEARDIGDGTVCAKHGSGASDKNFELVLRAVVVGWSSNRMGI